MAFVNRFVCRVIVIILYFNRKKAHAKLCESQRHGRERQNGNEKNAHGDTNFVSSNHHQQHAKWFKFVYMHIKHTPQLANFWSRFECKLCCLHSHTHRHREIYPLKRDGIFRCALVFERKRERIIQKQHQSRDLLWLQGKNNCVKTQQTNERTGKKSSEIFSMLVAWWNSATGSK